VLKYKGYEVKFKKNRYADNDNLYVGLDYFDDEFESYAPFGNITVNTDTKLKDMYAAIDTNNMGNEILKFIEDLGLAVDTGAVVHSGFCTYPVYKFSEMKLAELCSDEEVQGVVKYE